MHESDRRISPPVLEEVTLALYMVCKRQGRIRMGMIRGFLGFKGDRLVTGL